MRVPRWEGATGVSNEDTEAPSLDTNEEHRMKQVVSLTLLAASALLASPAAQCQVAGTTTLGVVTTKVQVVAPGWSAKRQIIGKRVRNEEGEEVGRIDDLIVSPDGGVSYAVIGAGGFVGMNRHHVAIPARQLVEVDGSFMLPGATRAVIKALPAFEYAPTTSVSAPAATSP
jgi:sporulation protein YlmC with PRC-barrel domain